MAQLTYSRQLPIERSYDLIVAGGGPSGVAASIAAGRAGLPVARIEQNGCPWAD
jgi:flavin-dependent dehydrogenase